MDAIDRKIIELLDENSRMPFLTIAKKIGTSEATVRNRVSKMQKNQIIRKFGIVWADNAGIEAVIAITTHTNKKTQAISEKIKISSNRVKQIMEVSGGFDLIIILDALTINELNRTIEKIRSINGVKSTQTFMVLKRI